MGARGETRFGWRAVAAALGLAVAFVPRVARADDSQTFELGKNRFEAGQYEEAARRFAVMVDPAQPPCDRAPPASPCRLLDADLIVSARSYYATTLIALKRVAEADEQIEKILRQDHGYRPSPAMFPPEIVDRFTEVRARLAPIFEAESRMQAERELHRQLELKEAADAQQRWIEEIRRLAGEETVVEKSSRLVALLPFGVGQFQNGDKGLGALFAVTEILAGATAIAAAGVEANYASVSGKTLATVDTVGLNNDLNAATTVNRVAFGAWAGLTLAGMLQAQLAFVPEKTTTRPRAVPPPPKLVPTVSLVRGGGVLGITGRF